MGLKESGLRGSLRNVSVGIAAIPDSENLHAHYDLQQQTEEDEETIDPLVDQSDNGHDADAVGSPTMDVDGFNGHPAAQLDDSNPDYWEIPSGSFETISQPYTVYVVIALADPDNNQSILSYQSTDDEQFIMDWQAPGWRLNAESGIEISGSDDGTINQLTALANGSNSIIEEEGTETASGDAGSNALESISIGYDAANDRRPIDGRFLELAIYDAAHDADTRQDWWNYADSRWSIS